MRFLLLLGFVFTFYSAGLSQSNTSKETIATDNSGQTNWKGVKDWKKYESKYFSLEYPTGSRVQEGEMVLIQPIGMGDIGFSIQTAGIDTTEVKTIEQIKTAIEGSIAQEKDVKLVSSRFRTLRDRKVWEVYIEQKQDESLLIYRSIYLVDNDKMSTLLFFAPQVTYKEIYVAVDKVFNSLK